MCSIVYLCVCISQAVRCEGQIESWLAILLGQLQASLRCQLATAIGVCMSDDCLGELEQRACMSQAEYTEQRLPDFSQDRNNNTDSANEGYAIFLHFCLTFFCMWRAAVFSLRMDPVHIFVCAI